METRKLPIEVTVTLTCQEISAISLAMMIAQPVIFAMGYGGAGKTLLDKMGTAAGFDVDELRKAANGDATESEWPTHIAEEIPS